MASKRLRPLESGRNPSVSSICSQRFREERGAADPAGGLAEDSVERLTGGNARNVGAVDANVGKFPIRQRGQFPQVTMIILEGLNRPDNGEQHDVGLLRRMDRSILGTKYRSWFGIAAQMMLRCS